MPQNKFKLLNKIHTYVIRAGTIGKGKPSRSLSEAGKIRLIEGFAKYLRYQVKTTHNFHSFWSKIFVIFLIKFWVLVIAIRRGIS